MGQSYVNGKFVDAKSASISLSDLACARGFAVNDYLRTYERRPFELERHLSRFEASAQFFKLAIPKSREEISLIIETLIASFPNEELGITLFLSGGLPQDYLLPDAEPSFAVKAGPLKTFPDLFYSEGIRACTTKHPRLFPKVKHCGYSSAILAFLENPGIDEIIYLNAKEELLEGGTTNFFAISKDAIYTASKEEVLEGVTRQIVTDLCLDLGLPLKEEAFPLSDLDQLESAFITSTNREVMPIKEFNGKTLLKHPFIELLQKAYKEYVSNYFLEHSSF